MPPRRRPVVKSRLEATPDIKPQATVAAGAFYAPARPNTDVNQLGQALLAMGNAAGQLMVKKAGIREKEDLATGTKIAMDHLAELRKDSSDALKQAEKNGWIPNGARPDVKEGYLRAVGAIWATSPILKNKLDWDMEVFINNLADKGGSLEDFHFALDARNKEIVDQAKGELDDNFYTRDEGFMGNILAPLAKHRKHWTDKYTQLITRKQIDVATKSVHDLWKDGRLDGGFNYWWKGVSGAEPIDWTDPISGKKVPAGARNIIAPKDLYPVNPGPRVGFFNIVESHALYNLAGNQYDMGGIARALRFVDYQAAKKNPANGASMDSGTMKESYELLKRKLQGQLSAAQGYLTANNKDLRASAGLKVEAVFKSYKEASEGERSKISIPGIASDKVEFRGFTDIEQVRKVVTDWQNNALPHPFREGAILPWNINDIVNKDERDKLIAEGLVLTDAEKAVFTDAHMYDVLHKALPFLQEQRVRSIAEQTRLGQEKIDEFKREDVGDAENLIIDFFHEFTDAWGTWTQEDLNAAVTGATEGLTDVADDFNIDFDEGQFAKTMQGIMTATHSESKVDPTASSDFNSLMLDIVGKRGLWFNVPNSTIRNNILKLSAGKRIKPDDIERILGILDEKRTSFKKWIDPLASDSAVNEIKKTLKARIIEREFNTLGKLIVVDNKQARDKNIWEGTGATEKWLDDSIDAVVDTKFMELMTNVAEKYNYDTSAIPANLLQWMATSTEEKEGKPALYDWGKGPVWGTATPAEQLGHGIAIESFLKILIDKYPTDADGKGGWHAEAVKRFN